ncbi:uncharacterized protein LOC134200064 [Bombyx mori]|uniref:uncharacterized protein LOC134200064 n=1 Tax=Bombyx mori TaxID=7091 RepID=UPI002ED2F38A
MRNDRYQRRIAENRARSGVEGEQQRREEDQVAELVRAARLHPLLGASADHDGAVVTGQDGVRGEVMPAPELSTGGVRRARAAGVDNNNWNTYSDTVPVYSVGVNTWANEDEVVPFSALYNHIAERITDPNATGALGALVKGSTMKDSASVITMVKHMQRGNGSYRDEAPLVRAYNMLNATAATGSPPDPIVYKWMRNFVPVGPVQLENLRGQPVGGSVIAVPHDMFTEYAFLNFNTPFPGIGTGINVFSLDSMDETWVTVQMLLFGTCIYALYLENVVSEIQASVNYLALYDGYPPHHSPPRLEVVSFLVSVVRAEISLQVPVLLEVCGESKLSLNTA